jgi:DsbC/DsbD-like thiol-disulfide interchange protein
MPRVTLYTVTVATLAFISISDIRVAQAQDTSPWETVPHGAARLIAGATHKSADDVWLRAGIEIRLDPGWHTYWRYPGESGVPPRFDFTGSENVKSVTVLWPAPKRFVDNAGGHPIGYLGDVVFPVLITALDTARPSSLHAKVGYAVCGKFCLPAEANLELTLSGKAGSLEAALIAAEARVPRRVPLGAGAGLAIHSVHREASDGRERVIVDVAVPEGTPLDLLVEGPTPDWALPSPEPMTPAATNESGVRLFTFDLDGLPPGAHPHGATLTFTVVSPDEAIELSADID